MTNLQAAADSQRETLRQRLLLGVPIGVGVLLAGVVVGTLGVPQWLRLQSDSERLAELQALQARIPLLRSQLAKSAADQEDAERKQRKILSLIQGSGEFLTFLAQVDREAGRSGIQLELYEPVVAPPPAAQQPSQGQANQAPPPKLPPLEEAGLASEKVLLTARGPYPSLLAFVRSVEKLSLLVEPSQFAMALVEVPAPPGTPSAGAAQVKLTQPELKLLLTYYKAPKDGLKPPAPPTPPPAPKQG
ncbi:MULTISPECIES: hypothetical protein [Aphanothece]|uniref:hypothetical protein n=1 Tax=Aphanothece TaxID=1121 RepID=UPI003984EB65